MVVYGKTLKMILVQTMNIIDTTFVSMKIEKVRLKC